MKEQELQELYRRWKEKSDPEALRKIIKHYEPFIHQVNTKWNAHFHPGVFKGLAKKQIIEALRTYNPNKGASLSTHVYNYLQKLSRYSMSYGEAIRMPENLRLKVSALMEAYNKLEDMLGRPPTTDELADELGWNKSEVERIHKYMFEEKAEGGQTVPAVMDTFEPNEAVIEAVYRDLSPQEKLVFEHLTGYGGKPILQAKEIARILNTSPANVTRIKKKIIEKFEQALY